MTFSNWRQVELGQVVMMQSGGTPSKQDESFWNGEIPWVSAKDLKTFFLNTSADTITGSGAANGTRIAKRGWLLVLVRGMTLLKDVPVCYLTRDMAFNQDLKALVPKDIDALYLGYYLVSRKTQLLSLVNVSGHGTGRLQTDLLEALPVQVPPREEQVWIARTLRSWDQAIDAAERLIAAKQERRAWLMQQLLTGKRRLPGFKRHWHTRHLGEIVTNRVETGRSDLPLIAITRERGVVRRDDLVRRDTSCEDKSRYLRICPGDIGYNTMRMWQGVCGLSSDDGIVSPAYTVVTPSEEVHGAFLALLFKSPEVIHLFHRHSQGLVDDTLNLKYPAFAKIKVRIPGKDEQKAISAVFETTDREIELLGKQTLALLEQKKGLMQQLLTGKRRLTSKG
jgi:type I restriction enzyme S subunit